ncbi:hypothetical protein LG201_07320 [Methylobacillus gramineus]|uniref:hypothetical protein n=1 Tax=Methylobacillus gramineus TaxID=755169 RepID=UPI001CFFE405|nr:hypothetical protein [Methylobacillus gramineus]MCB5185011.1 hypothetical protein [Methylobacillus gramineus]
MKLSFRSLAILISVLFLALAFTWMFAPQRLLVGWGIELTPSASVVGRRAAALYAGVAIMFWSARNAGPSPARSALIKGLAMACLMLASLGVFEWVAGHAAPGILVAVVIEIMLTLALLHVGRKSSGTLGQ